MICREEESRPLDDHRRLQSHQLEPATRMPSEYDWHCQWPGRPPWEGIHDSRLDQDNPRLLKRGHSLHDGLTPPRRDHQRHQSRVVERAGNRGSELLEGATAARNNFHRGAIAVSPFFAGSSQGCDHQSGPTHTRLAKASRRIDRDAFLNLHAPKIGLISRYGTRPWLHGEPASSGGVPLWPLGGVGDRQGHDQPGDGPERPGLCVPPGPGAL